MNTIVNLITQQHISQWLIKMSLCVGLLLFLQPIQAQTEDQETKAPQFVEYKDTLGLVYRYVHVSDIYQIYEAIDSLEVPVFLSNVHDSGKSVLIHTGNYGSATSSLYKDFEINTGFNTGYTQYATYQIRKEQFRFYEQNRPVSNLFFSQTGSQDNIAVGADFSRNFQNGLSVSLNYKRLSQKGFFNEQETKSTAFGIGFRYQSPSNRYNGILVFIQNANEERFNGGILADSLLSERFRKAIPTLLTNASSRHQEQSLSFIQYYRLNASAHPKWKLYLSNDLSYQPNYYKFWDKNIDSTAQAFYDIKNELLIPSGIRRYTDVKKYSESFFIHGDNNQGIKGKIGLAYELYRIKDLPKSFNRSDLTAIAEGNIPFLKALELAVKGKIGLLENIGTFDLSGDLEIRFEKLGAMSGGMRLFRYEPSYRSTQLQINGITWIDTSFTNPFGTNFHATLHIPSIHFKASVNQYLITNPVYWNTDSRAAQYDGLFTISQLSLHHTLSLKYFGFENSAYFQLQNNRLYPVPDFFSTHKIYYKGDWFDAAMQINIGFEGRIIPAYNGPGFQPLFGSYHLTDDPLAFTPEANFFIHAKVSSFRALLSLDNFSRYFIKDHIYNIVGYPVFDPVFRFGIQWMLKD
ncbi:MAG: hypothetical protein LC107_07945 [Chitinophagales bacterium]|nr:hypothetical protein [Chitinophagales bacterium]